MQDSNQYMIKLSQKDGLGWFKNVILMYAFNDGYVNFESAKILFKNPYTKKQRNIEMAKNIYESLNASSLIKMGFYCPKVNKGFE